MGEVINLRLARKAMARSQAESQAEENRVKFGQTKAEKNARRAEKLRADAKHEAGRIEEEKNKTSLPEISSPDETEKAGR